jgi:membrane associated rhomboid family serine protease
MFPIRDHNPSKHMPYVTYVLIVLNIGVFLAYWPLFSDNRALFGFYQNWALVPRFVSAGEMPHTLITSMFLHGGWMHLIGNMLFLWIFGDNLEDELGHLKFLMFYLATGLVAALCHIIVEPRSVIPTVGASGAIAGVMGGYLLLFPKARVDILLILVIFFRVFPVPAWLMLGVWFGLQLFSGLSASSEVGGVAYWAHIGGFVAGLVLILPLWLRLGARTYWVQTEGHPPRPEAEYRFARSSIPTVKR